MKVIADICVVPFTGQASVRKQVAKAHQILVDTGLPTLLHGYGTNIEGDYDVVMGALKRIHEALHEDGATRISTTIRLGSRTDKQQSIQDKIDVVQ
ncbi:MAG: MTH1187 family thiamine-binding protein, partial [Planctomycetes bacterium]|nr:MTH1187 family thiamine-binding protein [Planctomycetota bacterium]